MARCCWKLPLGVAFTVNGMDVIGGLQVIEPYDWVRSKEISFLVRRQAAHVEPGDCRICAATGRRIQEENAVRCTACGKFMSQTPPSKWENA